MRALISNLGKTMKDEHSMNFLSNLWFYLVAMSLDEVAVTRAKQLRDRFREKETCFLRN